MLSRVFLFFLFFCFLVRKRRSRPANVLLFVFFMTRAMCLLFWFFCLFFFLRCAFNLIFSISFARDSINGWMDGLMKDYGGQVVGSGGYSPAAFRLKSTN